MTLGLLGVIVVLLANLVLIGLVVLRTAVVASAGGPALLALILVALPVAGFTLGGIEQAERAKQTDFCLSCHVMEPYGRSLQVDSPDHLPAQHFQNARVPQDRGCYVCHTNYTMFGDLQAKLNGLRHVLVNYSGQAPERLSLYQPYRNRECLYCHQTARNFVENPLHADITAELVRNEVSCLECHDLSHDVDALAELPLWDGIP